MEKELILSATKHNKQSAKLTYYNENLNIQIYSSHTLLDIVLDSNKIKHLINTDSCTVWYNNERVLISIYVTGYKGNKHLEICYKDFAYTFNIKGSVINEFLNIQTSSKRNKHTCANSVYSTIQEKKFTYSI